MLPSKKKWRWHNATHACVYFFPKKELHLWGGRGDSRAARAILFLMHAHHNALEIRKCRVQVVHGVVGRNRTKLDAVMTQHLVARAFQKTVQVLCALLVVVYG